MSNFMQPIFDAINNLTEEQKMTGLPELVSYMGGFGTTTVSIPGQTYSFQNIDIQPPSNLYIKENSILKLNCQTTQTNEIFTVTANVLINDTIQTITNSVTTSTGGLLFTNLPEGFLLSASVSSSVALLRGQSYIILKLYDQSSVLQNVLLAGYTTQNKPISYPPITIEDSFSGNVPFTIKNLTLVSSNQIARISCPAQRVYKIHNINIRLLTDTTVQNRQVYLSYQAATLWCPILQPATKGYTYNLNEQISQDISLVNPTQISIQIPVITLTRGTSLDINIDNAAAGDAFTGSPVATIEEYIVI